MIKDIYILHVDGDIAFYRHDEKPDYGFAPQDKFVEFINNIRETYPDYRIRCIRNEGLRDWLRQRKSEVLPSQPNISKSRNVLCYFYKNTIHQK